MIRKLFKRKSSSTDANDWSGNYSSWDEANKFCTGYDEAHILERVKNALIKVKNGEAVYERDTVLFEKIEYSWPLLAILLRAAIENKNRLNVIDFGGSLGSTYYQNRGFLNGLDFVQWNVVEQSNFVECGKKHFQDDKLKFKESVSEIDLNSVNVFIMSCVLQYIKNPYDIVSLAIKSNIEYIVIDRLALTDGDKDILTIQSVPEDFFKAKLSHWFFSKSVFLKQFENFYDLIVMEPAFAERDILINGTTRAYFSILVMKLKRR